MSAPASTGMTCAAWKFVPKIAIGTAASRLGSGSQTSNAGRGGATSGPV